MKVIIGKAKMFSIPNNHIEIFSANSSIYEIKSIQSKGLFMREKSDKVDSHSAAEF